MSQQDWKKYWNNPNSRQYVLNYFWNHIGFEQNTNRAIFHNGAMGNAQYLDNWKFIYQNNQNRFLFDRQNRRLYDINLNYYDGRGYYTPDHRLIEDAYGDYIYELKSTFKERDELFKTLINQDPLYGNGRAKDPINTSYSDYFTNYNGTNSYSNKDKTIFKNYQKDDKNPYVINNDEKFKQKFTNSQQKQKSNVTKQSNSTSTTKQSTVNAQQFKEKNIVNSQPKLTTESITKEKIKQAINKDIVMGNGKAKEPLPYVQNRNFQQEAVDKLIAEFNTKNTENINVSVKKDVKESIDNSNKMVKKQLTEASREKIHSSTTKIDTRGHSMTQAVHNYNNKVVAKTTTSTSNIKNVSKTMKSNVYKPVRNVDSATVGKIITGVIDNNTVDLAAKVAADFSQFRYGKIISKLF